MRAQACSSVLVLNQESTICSPKISIFCLSMGFSQNMPQWFHWGTDPAQLPAGFNLGMRLCPLQTSPGDPLLGPSPCPPAKPLSKHSAAGMQRSGEQGGIRRRDWGDSWEWDHALPYSEVPRFGGALHGG